MNEAKSHGNMIIFLLLAFSVAKVRAVPGVGCRGGWVNFTCESPDNNSLPMNRTRIINNTVVVKNLQQEDNGILCPTPKRREIQIVDCKNPDKNHTVYKKAQATIECGRPDSSYNYGQVYLCKETGDFDCEDVLLLNPNGKFSMSKKKQGPHVTITNITPEDQGIYWCVEHQELTSGYGFDRSYRKINITVRSDYSDHLKYGSIGEDSELSCEYPKKGQENEFFCKGEDPHTCHHLVNSSMPYLNPEKITQFEDSEDRINVTMLNITAEDEGTYWFGGGNAIDHGLEIFCRLELIVGLSDSEPDDQPTEESSILSIVSLCVCVAVLVLLVVVVLVLIKKGKRRNDAPPQNNRQEEYVYEEVQPPTARKAVTTVYATADACQDSLHYMTVDFGKSGNTSEPKPSSSQCQYSTVFNKRADTCAIQAAPPEEPLYCNVNTKY